jgi:TRAP-type C4-dicarboxylate transport system permease small subunit
LTWLRKLDAYLEEWILIASLVVTVGIIFYQVVTRYVFSSPPSWSEELARYIFLWQIWIGASMAAKYRKHLQVSLFRDMLPEKIQKIVEVIVLLLWTGFCIFLAWNGSSLALKVQRQLSPAMRISMFYSYASVPVGCALMAFRLIQQLVEMGRQQVRG